MKSILVIGATGLLGEPVARRLKQDGYNVRLMIREQMKLASDFMAAFERIGERGDPSAANDILGSPTIRLEDWLQQKKNEE